MNTAKLKTSRKRPKSAPPLKDLKEQTVLNMPKNTCEKFIKFTAPKIPETSKKRYQNDVKKCHQDGTKDQKITKAT